MGWLSLSTVTGAAFVFYAAHTFNYFYGLFHPPVCDGGVQTRCYPPLIAPDALGNWPLLQMRVYVGERSSQLKLVHTFRNFDLGQASDKQVTFDLPESTRRNGSLVAYVYVLPHEHEGPPGQAKWYVEDFVSLSTWRVPTASSFNLMGGGDKGEEERTTFKREKPVTHIRSILPVRICSDAISFQASAVPGEVRHLMQLVSGKYLPLMRIEHLSMRVKHLNEVKPTNETTVVSIQYEPSSIGKMRLFASTEASLVQLSQLHLQEDDLDEVKGIFVDTNPLLLFVTILVSALHLCFDFLAFKNDISFWRNRKSMTGLSTRTLIWRAVSSTIIFFYLMEHKTSLLVLAPAGITVLIEYWKVLKALKVSISYRGGLPRISLGDQSESEAETGSIDSQAMHYLSALLVPLCLGGAVYSLLYQPHRSWRSWVLETAANGVYAFGFLFMLPQLFVNYKLKSVAHLPWRAFMYKAFNTFIDDLFAFIITMPTAHRVACFRDDIVFLVYLYQRWLYPVDKSRVNEYGEDFTEEEKKDKHEKKE